MSCYILGAYFSPMLPIVTGAKENTLLGLHSATLNYSLPFPIRTIGEKWNFTARKCVKSSFPHRKHTASIFADLLCSVFLVKYLCEIVCLKR